MAAFSFNTESELEGEVACIQEGMACRDKLLQHFNEMSSIENKTNLSYSIILESEDFEKELKTSASTNASHSGPYCEGKHENEFNLMGIEKKDSVSEGFY